MHDLLHRGPILRTSDSVAVRPCIPSALLSTRPDEALGGTTNHIRFLSVPDLQNTDGSSDIVRTIGKCERALRRRTKEGVNALGIRRLAQVISSRQYLMMQNRYVIINVLKLFFEIIFSQSRRSFRAWRSLSGSRCLRDGTVCVLRVLQMPEGLLRW